MDDQRQQVRKELRELLSQRSKDCVDLGMDLQSISVLVSKLEKFLNNAHKEDYMAKYRQLYLHLKNDKIDDFLRKASDIERRKKLNQKIWSGKLSE